MRLTNSSNPSTHFPTYTVKQNESLFVHHTKYMSCALQKLNDFQTKMKRPNFQEMNIINNFTQCLKTTHQFQDIKSSSRNSVRAHLCS